MKPFFHLLVLSLMVGSLVSGCAAFNTLKRENHVTIGQELIDLKRAHDVGIITESQYQEQVQLLLAKNKKRD